MKKVVIGAIDVGAPRNMGWAIVEGKNEEHGTDLDEFIVRFAKRIQGKPSALGFECPLFVPCRDELSTITKARQGDGSRSWSAGAGATVTTIGLAVVTYTLRKLNAELGEAFPKAMLDWKRWPDGDALLLWEAFVSGANHAAPGEHWRDALNAAKGFQAALDDLDAANAVIEESVFSTIGAAMLRCGVSTDVGVIQESCLVLRP